MRDILITRVQQAALELGRTPTLREAEQYKVHRRGFLRHFESYNKLLEVAGIPINKLNKRAVIVKSCGGCDSEFETNRLDQQYCSKSCSNSVNKKKHNIHTTNTCPECNTEHDRFSDFCSQLCRNMYSGRGITKSSVIRRKGGANAYDIIRQRARSIAKHLYNQECVICGYNTHVEIAHIKDITKYGDGALLTEINHPDNLVCLCKNHHWEFDNGLIKEVDVLSKRKRRDR